MQVFWLVVVGTSLWMYFESRSFGYEKKDLSGLAAIGPLGWYLCGMLLWIVALPLYLASRAKLRAAGEALKARVAADPTQAPRPRGNGQPVFVAVASAVVVLAVMNAKQPAGVVNAGAPMADQDLDEPAGTAAEPAAPSRDPNLIADGTYMVGSEIAPGLYRVGRYWARQDRNQATIDNDLTTGCPTLVNVQATDAYLKITGEAIPANLRVIDPIAEGCSAGTFLVGTDIAPGRYRLKGSEMVYWARLNNKLGTIDNDITRGQSILVVRAKDFAVKINNVESIERIGN
jgi:hypothetical protein